MMAIDLTTVAMCAASALFGAAVSFIALSRSNAVIINTDHEKEKTKVVNSVDIEDLSQGTNAFCRCWKSKKFPYCDGSHNAHNVATGDNLGPLLVKKD